MQPAIPIAPSYPPKAPIYNCSQSGGASSRHGTSGQATPSASRMSQQPRSSRHAVGPQRQEPRHSVSGRHNSSAADHRTRPSASDPRRWESHDTASRHSQPSRPPAAPRRSTSRRDQSRRHSRSLAAEEPLVVNGARGRRHRCRDSSDEESEGSDRESSASTDESERNGEILFCLTQGNHANRSAVRDLTRRMRNL